MMHSTFLANPLQMIESAKTEVDYECALREQRQLNEEFHARKRALEEAEWAGLQLAQKMEQEDKDQSFANSLVQSEMTELERLKRAQKQAARDDHKLAKELLDLEAFEVKRMKKIMETAAQEDLKLAMKLQQEENRIAQQEALRAKQAEEVRLRTLNWIEPNVHCEQDAATSSMRIWVELPNLGQTDVVVKPENGSCTVVSISALSTDAKKTFAFDLKLQGDQAFNVRPEHVNAQYTEQTGILEIRVRGLTLNVKQEESSFMQRIKNFFQ